MTELTPKQSSSLARDVYALSDYSDIRRALSQFQSLYNNLADIGDNNILAGKTGGPGFIKSRTAFGFIFLGKGEYKGHAFFLFRGTSYLGDWLSNFNVGTSRSFYGQPVHNGFNVAFKSMLCKIQPFVSSLSKSDVHTVHCIGHSLGGALATLCAEYIKSQTAYSPYLYTYGMPRVGCQAFADMVTSNIKPERIFRVYHRTDIVPCIPFWPFVHIPTRMGDHYQYFLPSLGDFPGGQWHSMKLYVQSVGSQKWESLRSLKDRLRNDASVEAWLKRDTPVSFSVSNLEWINSALVYVVNKCVTLAGDSLTGVSGSTFTLMDRLAYIVKKGINISQDMSSWVVMLISKIMRILGLGKVVDVADLTQRFIRNIFVTLSQRVSVYCQRVLDQVLVDGRSM